MEICTYKMVNNQEVEKESLDRIPKLHGDERDVYLIFRSKGTIGTTLRRERNS